MFYEGEYLVDSRDMDPWYHCRPSGLLGDPPGGGGVRPPAPSTSPGRRCWNKYNLFWMLARLWYRLDRPLKWGERVTVRTWHRGGKGASTYRDFDLLVNGQPVGEAVSLWVLADEQTHQSGPAQRY